MKMKFAVLALSLVLVAPMARADDAAKHAKAEQLITVMHLDHMMDNMFDQMKAQLPSMVGASMPEAQMNAQQKALLTEFEEKFFDVLRGEIKTQVMPQMADVYAKTFTDEELDGMIKFYSSPIGQSAITKMPQAMQNSMQSMQGMMADMEPKMKALADEYQPKFKAAGMADTK